MPVLLTIQTAQIASHPVLHTGCEAILIWSQALPLFVPLHHLCVPLVGKLVNIKNFRPSHGPPPF